MGRRSYLCFLIAAAALLGSSCIGTFFASATGDLERGVVFQFHDSVRRDKAVRVDIDEFEIRRKSPNEKWTSCWLIKGRGSVDQIRYGTVPKGFGVISGPLKLEPGEYELYGKGPSKSKGASHGSLLFTIDKDGAVRFEGVP